LFMNTVYGSSLPFYAGETVQASGSDYLLSQPSR
jgi:hypothetical protein